MMTDGTFETILGGQLRAYAEAGVRPIDRYDIAEAAIATGRNVFVRAFGRRAAVLALAGLVLLALAGALVFIVGRQPAPTIGGGYEAIFLRSSVDAPDAGVDIIAVRPDGKERLVRHLDSADLPDNKTYETYGSVSQDGWVAVGTHLGVQRRYSWALMDLNDTAKAPRLVPYQPVIGGAWGAAGLFATTEPA